MKLNTGVRLTFSTLIFIGLVLGMQGCGGGGDSSPADGSQSDQTNTIPNLSVRIGEISTAVSQYDGFIEVNGYLNNDGTYIHNYSDIGRSFCVPSSPYAAPVINSATGTTTIFGCNNDISVTYEVVDPSTLQLIVSAPKTYAQVSGSVTYAATKYNYLGYVTADDLKVAFNISIIDNNDGTYSFGTVSEASIYPFYTIMIGSSLTNLKFITNNTTVNQFIATGNFDIMAFYRASPEGQLSVILSTAVNNMGSFIF